MLLREVLIEEDVAVCEQQLRQGHELQCVVHCMDHAPVIYCGFDRANLLLEQDVERQLICDLQGLTSNRAGRKHGVRIRQELSPCLQDGDSRLPATILGMLAPRA